MSKIEEFLNSSGVPEWLPTRIDPALYNYDPGNMTPGTIGIAAAGTPNLSTF